MDLQQYLAMSLASASTFSRISSPRWAMDDRTAIAVTDGAVGTIPDGYGWLITQSTGSPEPVQSTRIL
jgi:hypothetical protein